MRTKYSVTTTDSENTLSVTGTFTADGDTNTDAVIFSKDDLVLNGVGVLNIQSSDNGVTCKDDPDCRRRNQYFDQQGWYPCGK